MKNITVPESQRYLRLDFLRFIAAMGIVLVHLRTRIIGFDGSYFLSDTIVGFEAFVDLFFLISGYIIAELYYNVLRDFSSYKLFLLKRIARLFPLHILTLGLFFIGGYIIINTGQVSPDFIFWYRESCFLQNFFLIHSFDTCDGASFNYVSWSISAEMGMYVLSPILFYFTKRMNLFIFILGIALLVWSLDLESSAWFERTENFGVLRALPGFLLGILCFRSKSILKKLPYSHILFVISLVLIFPVMIFYKGYGGLLIAYLCPILAICADQRGKPGKYISSLAWLGKLTYSIYMWHVAVISFGLSGIVQGILKINGFELNLFIILAIIGLLFLSILSYQFFEMPMRKLLTSGLKKGNSSLGVTAINKGSQK